MPAVTAPSLPFAEVAQTSAAVAATSARSAKTAAIAALLRRAPVTEVGLVAAYLAGEPPQRRTGVGWATIAADAPPAATVPTLTVADIDRLLDDLVAQAGPGSATARRALLRDVFVRATPLEADFVRRLLSGGLHQGANEGVVLDAVAAAAGVPATLVRRALMLAGDLVTVATTAATAGRDGLAAIGLAVGRPLRPMLAATAPDVASAVGELGPSSVEWKLDGARIQVHKAGDEITIVTRNLNDVSHRLPAVAALVRGLPAQALVLDGEVVGFDDADRPEAFQDTMARFSNEAADEAVRATLTPWFFDCLHRDGLDLVDEPLAARLDHLEAVAGPHRIPGVRTADPAEAEAILAEALAAGHEGVVVKALDAPYAAGRRGKTWRKVKPVHTLDLVVLGAEWGHGRRRGWLSNLHLGARDGDGFVMVGKTFKGLTDEVLRWQTEALLAREIRREGITVYVAPTLVVEIALDGVQRSSRYPGGVALRFARVRRYREDKAASEADTIATVAAMR